MLLVGISLPELFVVAQLFAVSNEAIADWPA
jgi:hypothetical protein